MELTSLLDKLASQASPAGGWGYAPDRSPQAEPTCLALLALSLEPDRYADRIAVGLRVLESFARKTGGYGVASGRDEAVWPTALVLFARSAIGVDTSPESEVPALAGASGYDGNGGRVANGALSTQHSALRTSSSALSTFLLDVRGRIPPDTDVAEQGDIDHRLIGWPWALDNFSWLEPTAWACLALKRAGLGQHERVRAGVKLLWDRALDEGGGNYGNRRVFGRLTEPQVGPTAIMLLALQGEGRHPRVEAALEYLRRQAEESEDLEDLCWMRIALNAWDEKDSLDREPGRGNGSCRSHDVAGCAGRAASEPRLQVNRCSQARIETAYQARAEAGWLRPSPLREALTALALGVERKNFFRLTPLTPDPSPRGRGEQIHPSPSGRGVGGEGFMQRFRSGFRGFLLGGVARLRPLPPTTSVHIARALDYDADLVAILSRQYDSFRAQVPLAGKHIVLKPNLVEYHRDKVINTDPRVVAAVIELCRREGAADIKVGEGPGHCRNAEHLVAASGLGEVLDRQRVPFVDLNHDEPARRLNLGRLTRIEYLYFARTIAEAEVLISLPKLKTHHWAGATLSLKNLFGTLPGICYGWPKNELHWRGIDNSIVDIALTRPPDLAIVDGIVGMEGDGPLNGTPRRLGALVMGADPLAVDATCCRLMGLRPERVGYLALGAQKRLGLLAEQQIAQIGEAIADLAQPFETLPRFEALKGEKPENRGTRAETNSAVRDCAAS